MNRLTFSISVPLILCLLFGAAVQTTRGSRTAAPSKPASATPAPDEGKTGPVKQAILAAVNTSRAAVPALQIYQQSVQDVRLSSDETWARAWLVSIDPQTGEAAPCEPGLVISQWDGAAWTVALPSDAKWVDALKQAPLNLLSQDDKNAQLEMMAKIQAEMPTAAFSGYSLPWQAGQTKFVSQTVFHDYYTPSGTAHYAFDFYVHDQIWPILASKPGIVWMYYDAVPTCYDPHCDQAVGNYIVVQDPTTTPTSYMLYLHLAQNSIPAELKHKGALVKQAQLVGQADNTGASFGDHLHFMVHTNPNSYWGQSVDIKFKDVKINGGRPRVLLDKSYCGSGDVCNDFQDSYTSFNTPVADNTTPTAGFNAPNNGDIVAARTLNLNGWGHDPQAGMFSLQAFVNYTGAWQAVNTAYFSSSLVYGWDWCSAGVPDGPVGLGIQATDLAGHVSAISAVRTVVKRFTCPVTAAGIDLPLPGAVVNSGVVTLSGWGTGETGLASLQALANLDGAWQAVGPASSASPLSFQWDMCAAGLPDGPLSVTFKATDTSGHTSPISDVHTFIKDYTCPPPTPDPDQVLICTSPNYVNCAAFGIGKYASGDAKHPMDPIPDASAYSIRVGANVQATLYDTKYFSERAVTYFDDDPNMEDNILREETMSSFIVEERTNKPSPPVLPAPTASYQAGDGVTLYWENKRGAVEYQVQLSGPANMTTGWQALPYLHLTGLAAGDYTWQVRGLNMNGASDWSASGAFTISSAKAPASGVVSAPFSDDMDGSTNLWSNSGLWRLGNIITATTPAHSGSQAWWYQDQSDGYYNTLGYPNSGNLTSPSIFIPDSGFNLRFWYRYDGEGSYPYFDQRWVQISVDGSPFANTLQLGFDVQNIWLQSPFIDLSSYAGHTIQVRFHFETLDKKYNTNHGWGVDDLSITRAAPPSCSDPNEPNDSLGNATPIRYGDSLAGQICPPGDVDMFTFTGSQGDVIGAGIDAQSIASNLDSVLYLLDENGNLLAWNDDKLARVLVDSQVYYRLPKDGTYYLKVIAWDHPSSGGSDHFYHLNLVKNSQKPVIDLLFPHDGGVIPDKPIKVMVNSADGLSGLSSDISHVDFMVHSGDWVNDGWQSLGSDWDGSDGWSADFDASALNGQTGLAFYAQAIDKAGNSRGTAAWNVSVIDDVTPPALDVQALPASAASTAIQLQWTASDDQTGLDHFEVKVAVNGGAWQDVDTNVPPDSRSLWYVGQQNHTYAFRIIAVDRAQNSNYLEVTTSIPSNVCQTFDSYEPDSSANAASIQVNGDFQVHNFCNPAGGSKGLGDQDWIQFTPQAGRRYRIQTVPLDDAASVNLTLFASDRTTVLAHATMDEFGKQTSITWTATSADPLLVKMEHFNPAVAGSSVSYKVYLLLNNLDVYFPWITH
jgi:murein DD-endopeptidase MepM/ murein hydrolase activator NlpD